MAKFKGSMLLYSKAINKPQGGCQQSFIALAIMGSAHKPLFRGVLWVFFYGPPLFF
jgi:hypothetical protein